MARPLYSALLTADLDVNGVQELGSPPDGSIWVVRFAGFTYGSYLGFIAAALSFTSEGPWLWLMPNSLHSYAGVEKQTSYWEGRLVIPEGASLWAQVSGGDTGDILTSGYVLTAP